MQHAATGYARWLLSTCPLLELARFPEDIQEQFERTGRTIDPAVLDRLLDVTGGHPKGEYRIAEPFLAEWIRRNDVEVVRPR